MQTDPVGYEDQMNLYAYVHNDPLNYTDPTGKVAQVCAIPTGPMQACAAAATKVGGWIAAAIGAIWVASEATDDSSDLPEDLVGVQDDKAGRQGNRHNSGPLSPEHGGTGDAESDFDVLNPSGNSEETDDGTRVGESGVRLRPGTDKKGPRIDVPASGDKPHETLHYPPKEKEPK